MSSETQGSSRVLTIPNSTDTEYEGAPGSTFVMKKLRGDVSVGAGTFLVKMKAGAAVPWHWHTPTEEFVVLKGTVVAQLKGTDPVRLSAGGYSQLPGKHIHRFRCTEDGETVLMVVSEAAYDMHFVDADEKEISEDEAMRIHAESGIAGW